MTKKTLETVLQEVDNALDSIQVAESKSFTAYDIVDKNYQKITNLRKNGVSLQDIFNSLQSIKEFNVTIGTFRTYISRIKKTRES